MTAAPEMGLDEASASSPRPKDARPSFVSASSTALRQSPRADASVVSDLPIWTPVRVDRLENGWARVLVGPRTLVYDALAGEARPVGPSTFAADAPAGWVSAADLDTKPPSRTALVEQAKAAASPELKRVILLRAWALDPFDVDVAKQVGPMAARGGVSRRDRSPFQRADLVFGCRGDLSRGVVVGGSVAGLGGTRPPTMAADVCVGHLDVRPPCPPANDEDDDDEGNPARAAAANDDVAAHKAALSRLVPRFGNHGPALRLALAAGGSDKPVFVATRLLVADGCSGCAPAVSTTDVRVERLRVPAGGPQPTLLHVVVPRYTGVIYDVVAAERADDLSSETESFDLGDGFDADPRDEPGPGEHLFMAPEACGCACDE